MPGENARVVYWLDGGVRVIIPAPNFVRELMSKGMTEQAAIKFIRDKDVPASATEVEITDVSMIEADRTFRAAWVIEGGTGRTKATSVRMDKARAIWLQKIRNSRRFAFRDEDRKLMRAVEENDNAKIADVAAEKQRLRDLPATFELGGATKPAALKALWPTGLMREEDILSGISEGTLGMDGIGPAPKPIPNDDTPF